MTTSSNRLAVAERPVAEDAMALQQQVRALTVRVARLEQQVQGTGPRDDADRALLEHLAVSIGDVPFTTAAVFRHVDLRDDAALRRALLDADIESPRQLGKLLARGGGMTGAVTVRRLHDEHRDGRLWQLVRV